MVTASATSAEVDFTAIECLVSFNVTARSVNKTERSITVSAANAFINEIITRSSRLIGLIPNTSYNITVAAIVETGNGNMRTATATRTIITLGKKFE